MAPPKRSLVRDDLHYPLALLGAGLAAYTSVALPLFTCYLPGFFICELSWRMLRQPMSFYTTYSLDATLWTYMASIAVWLSLAMMTCTFVLHTLAETRIELSGGGSVTQQAMTALQYVLSGERHADSELVRPNVTHRKPPRLAPAPPLRE